MLKFINFKSLPYHSQRRISCFAKVPLQIISRICLIHIFKLSSLAVEGSNGHIASCRSLF